MGVVTEKKGSKILSGPLRRESWQAITRASQDDHFWSRRGDLTRRREGDVERERMGCVMTLYSSSIKMAWQSWTDVLGRL